MGWGRGVYIYIWEVNSHNIDFDVIIWLKTADVNQVNMKDSEGDRSWESGKYKFMMSPYLFDEFSI